MSSSASGTASPARTFERWNRRLHFYMGLYFLGFLWLFSLTGLILNHGQWGVARAANARQERRTEHPVTVPDGASDLDRARNVMRQLGLAGEIELPAQRPGMFQFTASRPRDANQVRVDLTRGVAAVQHFDNSWLGRIRITHTFSGSRYDQPATGRDWIVTSVWVVAMDALALGLIVITLGSYYMWWRLKRDHRLGLACLAAGVLGCAWCVAGAL